jgi:hypothetical protein
MGARTLAANLDAPRSVALSSAARMRTMGAKRR